MGRFLFSSKTILTVLFGFFVCFVDGQIIISQVYEGAGNNKWIEVTNVGSATVNLQTPIQYKLAYWNKSNDNGNGAISGDPTSSIDLTGTLSPGQSYLMKNSQASTTVPHNPMPSANQSNTTVANFNGNDAIAIITGTNTIIDAFGNGINNKDISYHRNSTVNAPNATFTISEWTSKSLAEIAAANNTMTEYIGYHVHASNPVLSAPASLPAFTYVHGTAGSSAQTFTISGSNLNGTSVDLILGEESFEISENGVTYSDNISLPAYTGVSKTIYVKMKSGLAVGTYNDVILIAGGAAADKEVSISGTVTPPPVETAFTADGNSIYAYVVGSGPSTDHSYTLSGTNLTSNLTVSAPTNYEVSKTQGSGYAETVTFVPVSGGVPSSQIYVRLKAALAAGTYNGNLVLNTSGITDKSIVLSGRVNSLPPQNDLCDASTSLTINAAATNNTLDGSTITAPFPFNTPSGTNLGDVWYRFTVIYAAQYTITTGNFSGNVDMDLFNKLCPATTDDGRIAQGNNSSGTQEIISQYLTPGTYYIRVLAYNTTASTSSFSIRVSSPAILTPTKSTIAFGNVRKGDNASDSFSVSAVFLTPNSSIQITPSAHYAVSLTGNEGDWHTDQLILNTNTDGYIPPTTIYVLFNTNIACGSTSGTLTISGGGVSTQTVALSGNVQVDSPVNNQVDNITANGFNITWDAVINATSYKVEIYKKISGTLNSFNAPFDDIAGTGGNDGLWSGSIASTQISSYFTGGIWDLTRAYQANNALRMGTSTALGKLITPPINMTGNAILSFRAGAWDSTNEKTTLKVSITGGQLSAPTVVLAKGVFTTYNLNITGATGSVQITFEGNSSNDSRFFIDDIRIDAHTQSESQVGGSPFTVSAPATNFSIGDLEPNATYYYRVTALTGTCESIPTPEAIVTTDNKVIWNGIAWNNGSGPTKDINALIDGSYNISTSFTAKDITITENGMLNIPSDTHHTAYGNLYQYTDHQIVIESDGGLVQLGQTNGNDGKKIIVKRNADVPSTQYNLWGSPVGLQNMYGIYAVPANKVMQYNSTNDTYSVVNGAAALSVAAKGYSIKGPVANTGNSVAVNAQFDGIPNNGPLTLQISNAGNRFNLIANPYPSNLDLQKLYEENSNVLEMGDPTGSSLIQPTMYFWDNTNNTVMSQQGSGYTGQNYALYNAVSGIGIPATNGTKVPTGIVKPGQAFFVKGSVDNTGGEVLSFTNNLRTVSNNNVPYYKSANAQAADSYLMSLTTPTGIVNTISVSYHLHASNLFDLYDSKLLNASANDQFYSFSTDGIPLAIQGRQGQLNTVDTVVLGMKHYKDGQYEINLIEKKGIFDTSQAVYLKDKFKGITVNLNEGAYHYQAFAGIETNRFEIVYVSAATLGMDNIKTESGMKIYKTSEEYVIHSQTGKIESVEVFDMSGRLLGRKQSTGYKIQIDHSSLLNGAYILKIYMENGQIITKKVIK